MLPELTGVSLLTSKTNTSPRKPGRSTPWGATALVLVIEANAGLVDIIIACGADAVALQLSETGPPRDRIVADLQTDGMIHRPPEPGGVPRLGCLPPATNRLSDCSN